jgi:phosphoglucosamine mutase
MSDEMTDRIEKYLDSSDDIPLATGEHIGRTVDYVLGRNRYTGYIISLSRHSYKGLRVGLDAANGSAWMLAKSVFDALGAKTYVIGNEPSGVNINLGCGSTHIDALCELVRNNGLDIGFAFDGDADRCLAVNERGEVISGEGILYAAAKHLKKRGALEKNTVVTTVMTNLGLADALKRCEIECVSTDVGDRFVWEAMREGGFSLGGEESGHIIFSNLATTGDGLITAIKMMEILIESRLPSSRLCDGLVMYPQFTKSVRVCDKSAAIANEDVQKAYEKAKKTLHGVGRILLRPSGTEPVVRVMAEHPNEEICQKAVELIACAITGIQ